tara:strand:+ start:656 stop:973 length:318 start_codon:yes stop_codon:yes gene_type:complete
MAEDYIAQTGMALCGVMENALVEKGVPPAIARALSERACQPAARSTAKATVQTVKKTARRAKSAYSRKYKAAFKKIAPKYKLKSGKWKKGGFRSAVKAAHKAVKR